VWQRLATFFGTVAVLFAAAGAVFAADEVVHGGFLEFFPPAVTQQDLTHFVEASILAALVVAVIAVLLAAAYRRNGVERWWRYPAVLVALYCLPTSWATFRYLYPRDDGWRGPLVDAVAVAAWGWLLLGVGLVPVAFVRRGGERLHSRAAGALFVAVVVSVGIGLVVQDDVAARPLRVDLPPAARATGPCVVAGGGGGTIVRGADGRWTDHTLGDDAVIGVATDGRHWIALGDGFLAVSGDGRDWNRTTTVDDLHDAASDGHRWVAVGDAGVIRVSTDGATWTRAGSGTSEVLHAVATDGRRWVAAGDAAIVTSTDGRRWSADTTGVGVNGLATDGHRWVAVGGEDPYDGGGGVVVTSDDGQNWSVDHTGGMELLEVASGPHGWLAVGAQDAFEHDTWSSAGTVLASADGVQWREVGTQPLDAVAWDGSAWVGVYGTDVLTSPDGATWTVEATSRYALETVAATSCPAPG